MITLTDSAALQMKRILEKHTDAFGIQIGVKTTGCSGLAYTLSVYNPLNLDEHIYTEDNVDMIRFQNNEVWLYVDHKSEPYLIGTEIDFIVKDQFTTGFEFRNPAERDRCGCGQSFRI